MICSHSEGPSRRPLSLNKARSVRNVTGRVHLSADNRATAHRLLFCRGWWSETTPRLSSPFPTRTSDAKRCNADVSEKKSGCRQYSNVTRVVNIRGKETLKLSWHDGIFPDLHPSKKKSVENKHFGSTDAGPHDRSELSGQTTLPSALVMSVAIRENINSLLGLWLFGQLGLNSSSRWTKVQRVLTFFSELVQVLMWCRAAMFTSVSQKKMSWWIRNLQQQQQHTRRSKTRWTASCVTSCEWRLSWVRCLL